ncbi:HAD hydrolase-like protein [Patescibacteria group bacterium]|nr:HAD hydrolase-like protein [Patescibacteria group bacterium]MCL5091725.1 HAD hydrolase-like protein [Patescibacteria group bacterium]
MKKQTVIFDFDGTLADTWPIIKGIIKELAASYHFTISDTRIEQLRHRDYAEIREILHLPLWRIPGLLIKGRALFAQHITQVKLFPSLVTVLQELKKRGVKLGILTSNGADNVRGVLARYDLTAFDFVWSANNLFGKDRALKKIISQYRLDPKTTVYVGDEVRDIEACQRLKIEAAAVSWGLHPRHRLMLHHPTWLIDRPDALLQII